jgi:aspartyl-tRNA(Asn)/glutamyl-tRNA(Gln) amidotransferase subunit C
MKVTPDTVRSLAGLAQLELGADEIESMRRDLERILEYVEAVQALDTEGVPPTAHVLDLPTPLREDVARDPLPVEQAVANAPVHDRSSMIVPKVIE